MMERRGKRLQTEILWTVPALALLIAAGGCSPEAQAPVNGAIIANLAESPPMERNSAQEEAERLKTEGVPAAEIP